MRQFLICVAAFFLWASSSMAGTSYYQPVANIATMQALGANSPLIAHVFVASYISGYIGGGDFDWVAPAGAPGGACTADSGTVFLATGVGAGVGCWVRTNTTRLDVGMFGCQPFSINPSADCQAAINAGLTYLNANGGGTLWLLRSQQYTSTVTLLSNTTLSGECGGLNNPSSGTYASRLGGLGSGAYVIDTNQVTPIVNGGVQCMALTGQAGGPVQGGIRLNGSYSNIIDVGFNNFGEQALLVQQGPNRIEHILITNPLLNYTTNGSLSTYKGAVEIGGTDNYIDKSEIACSQVALISTNAYRSGLRFVSGGANNFISNTVTELCDTDITDQGGVNEFSNDRMDLAFGQGAYIAAGGGLWINSKVTSASQAANNTWPGIQLVSPYTSFAGTPTSFVNIGILNLNSTTTKNCIADPTSTATYRNTVDAATVNQCGNAATLNFSNAASLGMAIQTPHGPEINLTPCTSTINLDTTQDFGDLKCADAGAQTVTVSHGFNGMNIYFDLGANDTFAGQIGPGIYEFKNVGGTWTLVK